MTDPIITVKKRMTHEELQTIADMWGCEVSLAHEDGSGFEQLTFTPRKYKERAAQPSLFSEISSQEETSPKK